MSSLVARFSTMPSANVDTSTRALVWSKPASSCNRVAALRVSKATVTPAILPSRRRAVHHDSSCRSCKDTTGRERWCFRIARPATRDAAGIPRRAGLQRYRGRASLRAMAVTLAGQVSTGVCVYSGAPAGLACAIRAAREGLEVVLVTHTPHLGGMLTSGLCVWDTQWEGSRAPIYDELRQALFDYYRERYGHHSAQYHAALPGPRGHSNGNFEAGAARQVIEALVAREARIRVLRRMVAGRGAAGGAPDRERYLSAVCGCAPRRRRRRTGDGTGGGVRRRQLRGGPDGPRRVRLPHRAGIAGGARRALRGAHLRASGGGTAQPGGGA